MKTMGLRERSIDDLATAIRELGAANEWTEGAMLEPTKLRKGIETLLRKAVAFRDLMYKPELHRISFASGPGFYVVVAGEEIGTIGKHTHERHWWWQTTGPKSRRRAGDGLTKADALEALILAWWAS